MIGSITLPDETVVELGDDLHWTSKDEEQAKLFNRLFAVEEDTQLYAGLPLGFRTVARAEKVTGGKASYRKAEIPEGAES